MHTRDYSNTDARLSLIYSKLNLVGNSSIIGYAKKVPMSS